jgi:hypothetical protein
VSVAAMLADTPVWAYALVVSACLLLITIYFSPGEDDANQIEVRAFTAFLAAALLAAGCIIGWKVAALPFWKEFVGGS